MNPEALEWHDGAADPLLLLAHGTGFCKELWRPVASSLRDQGVAASALAWDTRGHGRAPALDIPASWWTFGTDLVGLVDQMERTGRLPESVVGVGHSMGGTVLVLAELLRPGTFTGLVLIEPVLLPPPFERNPYGPLAQGAIRRRPVFDSREELVETYLDKPLFQRWHPEVFEAYIDHGFREVPKGVALRCPREVEADLFSSGAESGGVRPPRRAVTPGPPDHHRRVRPAGTVSRNPAGGSPQRDHHLHGRPEPPGPDGTPRPGGRRNSRRAQQFFDSHPPARPISHRRGLSQASAERLSSPRLRPIRSGKAAWSRVPPPVSLSRAARYLSCSWHESPYAMHNTTGGCIRRETEVIFCLVFCTIHG